MKSLFRRSRNCPSCGDARHDFITEITMAPVGGCDMSYSVSACQTCGLLFASSLPDETVYSNYYQTLSKYDQATSPEQIPILDRIRAQATVDFCAPHIGKNSVIADLGCGIGYLLHKFNESGWPELYGIDPNPAAPQRANALFGLNNVYEGTLSDSPKLLPTKRLDLISLTGVLEHLWSPRRDLQELFKALSYGSLIFIEVPCLERFSRHPYEPFGEFSLEHIQYFSEKSLCTMFKSLGADLVTSKIIDLSPYTTDSLFCLFKITSLSGADQPIPLSRQDKEFLESYIAESATKIREAIQILKNNSGPYVVYGAGSHTARLLPILSQEGLDKDIIAIVDANRNLHGKNIGRWEIFPTERLDEFPKAKIIISSFRSQESISHNLTTRYLNELICLYPRTSDDSITAGRSPNNLR